MERNPIPAYWATPGLTLKPPISALPTGPVG